MVRNGTLGICCSLLVIQASEATKPTTQFNVGTILPSGAISIIEIIFYKLADSIFFSTHGSGDP